MINYSYNQPGPSISRLDELLSRNEVIYQNLKQKLDDINKSSQNIHRNITHIQTIYPQTSINNPTSSILSESSAVLQENHMRSLYSQRQKNIKSINQSDEITFSEMMPIQEEEQRLINSQERLLEVMREQSRLKEIQFLLKKKRIQEERQFQLAKLSKLNQIYYKQDPFLWQPESISRAETSEQPEVLKQQQQQQKQQQQSSPLYFPSHFQNELSKTTKGNSVYLNHTPKINPDLLKTEKDEMPTFRDLIRDKQINSSRVEKEKQYTKEQKKPISPRQNTPKLSEEKYSSRQPLFELIKIENNQKQNETKQQNAENNKQTNRSQGTIRSNNFENSSNQISFVAVSPQHSHEYRMLSNTINKNLNYIINSPECFLFIPFNKVYRSPILQIKPGGHVLLQRKSKTASIKKDANISDPIRYKFKSVLTDEQMVIKMLFGGRQQLDLTRRESKKIAIVGKRDTLKKKLHLGLMAFILQSISNLICNTRNSILVKIEHQEIGCEGNEGIVEAQVNVRIGGERLALLQLERAGEDIFQAIKRGKVQQKVLRVSKVSVKGELDWSFSIISSNRVDCQFLRCLGVSRICWSVNPLVKNYEDVRITLQSMRQFTNLRPSFE